MINRSLVRTRVMQTLFAFYQNNEKTPLTAQKELLTSFADTYDLYMALLDFVNCLTRYAEEQLEEQQRRARVTHVDYVPNRRFVENRWAKQIFENRQLRKYVDEQKLRWDSGMNAVISVYRQMVDAPFYQEYMSADECTYADDKRVWRHIIADLMAGNQALEEALEEMEVSYDHAHWTTDVEVVLSYVVKTLQRFRATDDADTELLNMFDSEDEKDFAVQLLKHALSGRDEYDQLINSHLSASWDANRVAYMDRIVLHVALAEIMHFDDIALQVSLNEYIEMSKEYSAPKSGSFVNGILIRIVHDLQAEGKIFKAAAAK